MMSSQQFFNRNSRMKAIEEITEKLCTTGEWASLT